MRLRARGGVVVLITNAPRPSESVARQLDRLDVPRETYDAIVSSGYVTRSVIKQRHGQSLYHLGPDCDRSIFNGLDVNFAPPETADYVVCSGLEDDEAKHGRLPSAARILACAQTVHGVRQSGRRRRARFDACLLRRRDSLYSWVFMNFHMMIFLS